jgi:hypothetical protein
MINGQKKGKSFERDLSKILNENFGGGFQRVPQSGASYGGLNRSRSVGMSQETINVLTGDIICPKSFPFSVEAKNYKDLQVLQVLTGTCRQLDEWIEQSTQEAVLSMRNPLIVFKLKNKGIFVCLNYDLIKDFNLDNYIKYKNFAIISLEKFLELKNSINIVRTFIEGQKTNG